MVWLIKTTRVEGEISSRLTLLFESIGKLSLEGYIGRWGGKNDMKVLVAEQDGLFRDFLVRSFKSWGYKVTCATSGIEAWEALKNERFLTAVINAAIPELNGIELIKKVRVELGDHKIYIIALFSASKTEAIAKGFAAGANDYLTKFIDERELRARVQVGERVAKLEKEIAEKDKQLVYFNDSFRADLQEAADIQKRLLPQRAPQVKHINFSWHYNPCHEVGGDMLNAFRLDDDNLGLYLLDVCGHGVPAAILSMAISNDLLPRAGKGSVLKQYIHGESRHRILTPREAAHKLNRDYLIHDTTSRYFTILFGILKLKELTFRYVRAGHPPAILVSEGGTRILKEGGDLPMGLFPDTEFTEQEVQLRRGDRLYIVSDGLGEAQNGNNEQFGYHRLAERLGRLYGEATLEESIASVTDDVNNWHVTQNDDISMIGLEVTDDPE